MDSGSLGDFISTTLVDQLQLATFELEKPITLHMACQGSRSKINLGCVAEMEYQGIREKCYFDVVNLREYDLILRTPFLFQHQVALSFNKTSVFVGSNHSLPIEGDNVSKLDVRAVDVLTRDIEQIRQDLLNEAESLGLFTPLELQLLPPLRDINHTIPLIDENLIYPWRPARCPEVFRQQWNEKRDAYISTGRWKFTTSRNTVPLMCIPKPN